jgi:hypothetical protein
MAHMNHENARAVGRLTRSTAQPKPKPSQSTRCHESNHRDRAAFHYNGSPLSLSGPTP